MKFLRNGAKSLAEGKVKLNKYYGALQIAFLLPIPLKLFVPKLVNFWHYFVRMLISVGRKFSFLSMMVTPVVNRNKRKVGHRPKKTISFFCI